MADKSAKSGTLAYSLCRLSKYKFKSITLITKALQLHKHINQRKS